MTGHTRLTRTRDQAISEFEADLQHHIHVENKIALPRVIAAEQPH
jgi:iron-sulfur cluster repair protein YtfE (RIC family)